jgi:hypothetical protein
MSHDDLPSDDVLLCYCTNLSVGALRTAVERGAWPPPGKERSGKLCTGCLGDLLYLLHRFSPEQGGVGRER